MALGRWRLRAGLLWRPVIGRTKCSTLVLLAASLLALLAVAGYGIVEDHRSTAERERVSAINLADSLQVHVSEMLSQTLSSLQGVQQDLANPQNRTPERRLAVLRAAMRYDPGSWMLGARGDSGFTMIDSAGEPVGLAGFGEVVDKALAVPSDDRLAILPAIYSPEHGDWYLPVRLHSLQPEGQPEYVFALVPARRLIGTSASVRLLPGGYLVFATTGGVRLFRYLEDRQEIQVSHQPISPATREMLRKGGKGSFEAANALNGEWTIFGYAASARFPIVASVAVPTQAMNQAWLSRSAGQMLLLAIASVAVVFFAFRLKSTRGALSHSQTLYQDLFESVGDPLLVLDRRGVIQACNLGAVRILGAASVAVLVGRNLMSLTVPDHDPERSRGQGRALLQSLQAGQRLSADWRFAKLDGGHAVEVEMRLSAFPEGNLDLLTVLLRDVGRERRYLQQQEYLASHDSLTGLLNRYAFLRQVQQRIDESAIQPLGVVLMDLNRFKEVNDTLGHHAGDAVLTEVGRRLKHLFGDGPGFVARLGGDEIAACAPLAAWADGLDGLCRDLQDMVGRPYTVDGVPLEMTASLGGAVYPEDAMTPADLLRCADIAMYVAKRELRSHQRYSPSLDNFSAEALTLQADFARAIREDGLSLVYQPKVSMGDGRLVGVEALSRWIHPAKGPVSPAVFIPLAETTELIHAFTEHVMNLALAQAAHWLKAGQGVPVSVNISANNLMDPDFVGMTQALLRRHAVPPFFLELEVTESALMRNPETALQRLAELRSLGVSLAIDDFGTGYASLAYLKKLPVDVLKIDKTFTAALASDDGDKRIVRSTIQLAHGFGMKVVAEGVETAEVAELLRKKGCDIAQGYFYSKPLGAQDFAQRWLAAAALETA